jgi:hypothetical protein
MEGKEKGSIRTQLNKGSNSLSLYLPFIREVFKGLSKEVFKDCFIGLLKAILERRA